MPEAVEPAISLISSIERLISSEVADCSSAAVAMPEMSAVLVSARDKISSKEFPETAAISVALPAKPALSLTLLIFIFVVS